ncbi:Protein involved in vacuolar polyphosphate accumulation, contains SPX domain [Phaffia rhodozyma]|uniref:Vacuolar transporter chaperone complex subunit 4 n=1 Tax=Phaffia rhodozyma TaxID=264483 RepID=A0A0F7SEC0_PHARH|nr:Protein involved in vacuolar polyphosphate accumulation, contains SPX domain [Phaffia rhodozyma]
MKFGRRIEQTLYPEWEAFYLDYKGLKKTLKQATENGLQWNDEDEAHFVKELEKELEKIAGFQDRKAKELASRIRVAEKTVKSLTSDPDVLNEQDEDDAEAQQSKFHIPSDPHGADEGSDDDEDDEDEEGGEDNSNSDDGSVNAVEERFRSLEEDVAILVADVHDLALFTKLNYTGFIKIVKKHDKVTGFPLKPVFSHQFLEKAPFHRYNYDAIIVKLSKLYDLVRTRGHPVEGDSGAGGSQNAFVRQTTKYWVHPDNIVQLKLNVLRHLPVLVFNSDKEFEPADSAITSIYFDNEDLDLYLGRLEKTEGAEAIRMRWYGGMDTKTIFVERKTHREDWTGEKSVKERFQIKEHQMNDYINGRMTMDEQLEAAAKAKGKDPKDADKVKGLANEVQYAIQTRKLRPVMRSFYNRTAFQLPGDARVRISLDTELTMVREDDFDGKDRTASADHPNGNWRRTDIGITPPFNQIDKKDSAEFPYAVLEVKLQTQMGQEPPEWVRDLVASHLVEAVPKFSKFIHGCAALLPERVALIPFWLPQMDIDIRKQSRGHQVDIHRPHHGVTSAGNSASVTPTSIGSPPPSEAPYNEPVSDGEFDDDDDPYSKLASKDDEAKQIKLTDAVMSRINEARAFREVKLRQEAEAKRLAGEGQVQGPSSTADRKPSTNGNTNSAKRAERPIHIEPLTGSRQFDAKYSSMLNSLGISKLFKSKSQREREQAEAGLDEEEEEDEGAPLDQPEMVRFSAPAGKRISVPVRIEPKVIFANERTFLRWLHVAVLLAGISTGLLNFVSVDDTAGMYSAFAFTLCALISVAYSAGMFGYRAISLRKRRDARYHDDLGPTLLGGIIIVALGINFILRLKSF